jgi:hypothetical protein
VLKPAEGESQDEERMGICGRTDDNGGNGDYGGGETGVRDSERTNSADGSVASELGWQ